MTPPPIRYPLPTLLVLTFLVVIAWRGASAIASVRKAIATAVHERFNPPAPKSDHPILDGPIVRKVLLLHDDVKLQKEPDGRVLDPIHRRGFFNVFDVWPLKGEPTHLRIGNQRAFGWVSTRDALVWNTRLVLIQDGVAKPIVKWDDQHAWHVDWVQDQEWKEVEGIHSVALDSLPYSEWAVLLSRDELLALLAICQAHAANDRIDLKERDELRARALVGRITSNERVSENEVSAILNTLPPRLDTPLKDESESVSERLARLNENWRTEVSWSELSFGVVRVADLP
jgi:hypothetical protein